MDHPPPLQPLDYHTPGQPSPRVRRRIRPRLIGRIIYLIVVGSLLFIAVRYLLNYYALMNSLMK